jgi:type II secretory pathway pseudopilin PulG
MKTEFRGRGSAKEKRGKPAFAFTLIELVIVIFIISLTTALVMPNLWDTGERAVKSEAKRIGNTMRYIYDEAAGKKKDYVITIDLSEGSWGYESKTVSRVFKMKDDVVFRDVVVPSLGEVLSGEIKLKFGPTGPEEPVILHLMKDEVEYTVMFNHMNGRSKVYEGYRLWDEEGETGDQGSGVGEQGSVKE